MMRKIYVCEYPEKCKFNKEFGDRVTFFDDTIGITDNSMIKFRELLVETHYHNHRIRLICVPTSNITVGFFVHDWNRRGSDREWTFVGDGFRNDGVGEGGAGYRYVLDLIRVFGLMEYTTFVEEVMNLYGYTPQDTEETRAMRFDQIREDLGYAPPEVKIQDVLDKYVEGMLEFVLSETHAVPSSFSPGAWA